MKDSGLVFPAYDVIHDVNTGRFAGLGTKSEGISLRDYFAGQALVGLLASETPTKCEKADRNAKDAYIVADAMLAEREKGV